MSTVSAWTGSIWECGDRPARIRAIDEDRDNRHAPPHCGFNLDAHRIGLIIESRLPVLGSSHPARSNDDDQDVAQAQLPLDVVAEIDAKGDAVDIHEYGFGTVLRAEAVEYTTRDGTGVAASIGDDDFRHDPANSEQSATQTAAA